MNTLAISRPLILSRESDEIPPCRYTLDDDFVGEAAVILDGNPAKRQRSWTLRDVVVFGRPGVAPLVVRHCEGAHLDHVDLRGFTEPAVLDCVWNLTAINLRIMRPPTAVGAGLVICSDSVTGDRWDNGTNDVRLLGGAIEGGADTPLLISDAAHVVVVGTKLHGVKANKGKTLPPAAIIRRCRMPIVFDACTSAWCGPVEAEGDRHSSPVIDVTPSPWAR